ncbi:MAG: DoxX family protein [Flavobacterium sp.]|nr:MAG: DoxX family protein [Flavobacterium sp.]
MNSKASYYMERSAAIIAAIILLQTLFFKFTAHPDSVYIFTTIGGEPYTRIVSGIVELIISFLLLFSRTSIYGALLGALTMLGAMGSHIFLLGIEVNGDNGTLFILAVVALLCCCYIIYLKSNQLSKHFKSQR